MSLSLKKLQTYRSSKFECLHMLCIKTCSFCGIQILITCSFLASLGRCIISLESRLCESCHQLYFEGKECRSNLSICQIFFRSANLLHKQGFAHHCTLQIGFIGNSAKVLKSTHGKCLLQLLAEVMLCSKECKENFHSAISFCQLSRF